MEATTDDFLTRPVHVEITRAARVGWAAYEGQYANKAAALEAVLADHVKHVEKHLLELDAGIGAVLITDIPNTDLSLIDAHFPAAGERFASIFPRKGADLVVRMLQRQFGGQHDARH